MVAPCRCAILLALTELTNLPLWSVDVEVFLADDGLASLWLGLETVMSHPGLEEIQGWGIDEQPEGMHAHAKLLVRATDASEARATGHDLLEQVVGTEPERVRRYPGITSQVAARPASVPEQYAEDARPQGPEDYESSLVAAAWYRSETVDDGRRLKVLSFSGSDPLERVDVQEGSDRVTVTLLERHPPRFLPDGTPSAATANIVTKCVEVVLGAALGERVVVDGATGRPPADIQPGDSGEWLNRAQALTVDLADFPCVPAPGSPPQ
jgi:hypothetical protein